MDSVMTLGGVDKSLAIEEIKYYPVASRDYWSIKADNILLGGKDIGLCPDKSCRLIFDTGTSLITTPSAHLSKLLPKLQLNDDCSNYKSLPNIQ
jgi:hypothetical protein